MHTNTEMQIHYACMPAATDTLTHTLTHRDTTHTVTHSVAAAHTYTADTPGGAGRTDLVSQSRCDLH